MDVDALIMAGGRGSRLRACGEKPLVRICGKPMIEYVINALKGVNGINRIIVAVSKCTPKTAIFARERGLEIIWTPGRGFCLDLRYAIERLRLRTVLVVCADLPLITSSFIDMVIRHYEECMKPALTVMTPLETCEKIGLSVDFVLNIGGRRLVPVGVSMIDGEKLRKTEGYLEEEIMIIEDIRAAINVDTPKDAEIAELLLQAFFHR
ncbi:MAG: NTP transferase domain-containing protein [Candidatus Bathyarchaeia archaeon]|nr:NTP transferase domain-containing protein [Candidatus Bathyarchaeota archaeon]